jgi:DNA-binding CsgD family transcriptional regulator/tetratricopeptide (TPR) repeat protein
MARSLEDGSLAGRGDFVGREAELGQVRGLVTGVTAGLGGVVLVAGEQGVGKSALLRAGLAGARAAGCRVGWGVADELGQRFPLQLMVECLGAEGRRAIEGGPAGDPSRAGNGHGNGGGPGRGMAGDGSGLIADGTAGLTGGVGGLGGLGLSGDPVLAGAERLLDLVDRLCVVSPVVVVAEDLQWADEASLLLWQRLARAARQVPLLVVGSVRPGSAREDMARLMREAAAQGVLVELGRLPRQEVGLLVAGLAGGRPGPRLAGVAEQAGGNPLYVRELVEALVRDGRVRAAGGVAELTAEPGRVAVPGSLVAAVGKRLAGLPAGASAVLQPAAVLGQEFSVTDLAVVTGRPAGELAEVLAQAMAGGVLAEAGARLGFRHGLIRQVLYEGVPASAREALHLQAAAALAQAGSTAERVAAQLVAAPGAGDEWVWQWLVEAVGVLAWRAPQVAAELLRRALAALPGSDPRREVLELGLIRVAFLLFANQDVEQVARSLLARTSDANRAAEASWLLAYALWRVGRPDEASAVEEQALARAGISEMWVARLRARHAITLFELGQWARAAAIAEQALAGGERAGDRFAVGYALHVLSVVANHRRDNAALLQYVGRALGVIGDDLATTDLRLILLSNRISVLGELDRLAEADATIREALALGERAGTPRLAIIMCAAAEHYLGVGQWDESLTFLEIAAGLPGAMSNPMLFHGLAALVAGHRGDVAAMDEHLAAVQDEEIGSVTGWTSGYPLVMARSMRAERAGRPGEAVTVLASCLDSAAEDMAFRYALLPALVRVALESGDADTAAAAAQAAGQEADREPLPVKTATADWCRGLVTADPSLVLAAADYHEAAGRLPERAQALEDAAVLLARVGDLRAARRAFIAAAGLYHDLGAAWDLRRADARLRRYGIRRTSRAARRERPTRGWAALTPTELKIARLVADGRSNPDIAAELFLSRYTVETHVSHILAKLSARSRAEIIRQGLRHQGPSGGLDSPDPAP